MITEPLQGNLHTQMAYLPENATHFYILLQLHSQCSVQIHKGKSVCMSISLGARVNTRVFKGFGKLKPPTFWFSTAEKPFFILQAMYFYLSFSSRHNRVKRKYASSPRITNNRENYSNCWNILLPLPQK